MTGPAASTWTFLYDLPPFQWQQSIRDHETRVYDEQASEHRSSSYCFCLNKQFARCNWHFCTCFTCGIFDEYPAIMYPYFFFVQFNLPGTQMRWDLAKSELTRIMGRARRRRREIEDILRGMQRTQHENNLWAHHLERKGLAMGHGRQMITTISRRLHQESDFLRRLAGRIATTIRKNQRRPYGDIAKKSTLRTQRQLARLDLFQQECVEEFCVHQPNYVPIRCSTLWNFHLNQWDYKLPRQQTIKTRVIGELLHRYARKGRGLPIENLRL